LNKLYETVTANSKAVAALIIVMVVILTEQQAKDKSVLQNKLDISKMRRCC